MVGAGRPLVETFAVADVNRRLGRLSPVTAESNLRPGRRGVHLDLYMHI
jgi:hypothetical protein